MAQIENENKKNKLTTFFGKIKKFKGVEVAIVVILVSVMLLIAFSSLKVKKTENKTQQTSDLDAYALNLEKKLDEVLSQIDGAGKVSSMITLEGGFTKKLATTSSKSTTNGEKGEMHSSNTTSDQNVVYTTQNGKETPVVLCVENPKVAGVVVVSSGANNVKVKLDIIRAVSTLLGCPSSCIEVLLGK